MSAWAIRHAPLLLETLYQQHKRYPYPQHDRFLFAAHAIRIIATSAQGPHHRRHGQLGQARRSRFGERLPEIPDFALDMHTRRGKEMGRDYRWFMEEASKVSPQIEDRDETYRQWIMDALAAGKLR